MKKSIVLLSGGLDSTVALFWAKAMLADVRALWIYYGQPARDQERGAAMTAAASADVEFAQAWCPEVTVRSGIRDGAAASMDVAPLIVPARNAILLSMAAHRGAVIWPGEPFEIVIGANADDAGFPDCSVDSARQMTCALSSALGVGVGVTMPLATRSKSEVVELAASLGCLPQARASWSCYRSGSAPCGECRACVVRAAGFAAVSLADGDNKFVSHGGDPVRDAALGLR